MSRRRDLSSDELRGAAEKATGPLTPPLVGLIVGLALGFAGAFGGFTAFIVVVVLAAVGTLAGLAVDGRLHLGRVFDRDDD